ncbi:MAG: ABC transporter permease [bacterium]|nr:ABC transporter permease [bacterium]
MFRFFRYIGRMVLRALEEAGGIFILFFQSLYWLFRPPFRGTIFLQQMEFIGTKSSFIVGLTGLFTGMVFALQTSYALRLFDLEYMIGPSTVLSLTRELGPVLTALLVTGRAGSAMCTEIGTMRVTEQVDALHTMAVSPVQYLVVPRIISGVLMLPLLAALFSLMGALGGYLIAVFMLGQSPNVFITETLYSVDANDFYIGLIKAAVFGLILTLVGCYKGYRAEGGSAGVGKATTEAVVLASVTVLISDYFLTSWMY